MTKFIRAGSNIIDVTIPADVPAGDHSVLVRRNLEPATPQRALTPPSLQHSPHCGSDFQPPAGSRGPH